MRELWLLESWLAGSGLWKEAFQVGELGRVSLEEVEDLDEIKGRAHRAFVGICQLYLDSLRDLGIILEAGFLKSAGEEVQILGPKGPEEMVGILEDLEWKGKRFHLWYDDFVDLVEEVLGIMRGEAAHRLLTDFLASTSVQTRPGHNFDLTMEYLYKMILAESKAGFEDYLKLLAPSAEGSKEERFEAKRERLEGAGLGESYLKPGERFMGHGIKEVDLNLARVMRGEDIVGPKVGPFARGLRLDYSSSPTDRHVARILLGKESPSSKGDFIKARQVMEEISRVTGLPILQVQSAVWCANLVLTGKPVESYNEIVISRQAELRDLLRRAEEIYLRK